VSAFIPRYGPSMIKGMTHPLPVFQATPRSGPEVSNLSIVVLSLAIGFDRDLKCVIQWIFEEEESDGCIRCTTLR
jgi:hypothetical protein